MKKIIFSACCLLSVCLTNAQTRFGVLSFTLPKGWISRSSGKDLEIVKMRGDNSGCKMILFQQLNTAVTGEKRFTELWNSYSRSGNAALQKQASPVKREDDGLVVISGSKITGSSEPYNTERFYTLCDGTLTALVMTESPGADCAAEIKSILATLKISVEVTDGNAKRRKIRKDRDSRLDRD